MKRNQKVMLSSWSRRLGMFMLVFVLFGQMLSGVTIAEANKASTSVDRSILKNHIDAAAKQLAGLDNLSDWAALSLAKAGHTVPDSYLTSAKLALQEWSTGGIRKVTDLERLTIALGALGNDQQNIGGLNPIAGIFNHPNMLKQGINGPLYALMILSSGSYNLPTSNQWNKANLLDAVLKQQNTDGGWSLSAGGKSTVDITAMALTTLSGFTSTDGVQSIIDKGVKWLTTVQLDNGGFNDSGDNSESASQVIIALSALGIDISAFDKSGANPLSHLMTFQQDDGGFSHLKGLGSNGMATEQALLALVAYDSFVKGEPFTLYQAAQLQANVDIFIEGPNGVVAEGSASGKTVLEALTNFTSSKGIKLGIKDTSFGQYVNAIGEINEGFYEGSDGWNFDVHRDGSWQFPAVGMTDFKLKQGDKVVIYYTDYSTQLVDQVTVLPAKPKEGQPFTVSAEQFRWDWDSNTVQGTPATGVRIQVGGSSVLTDHLGVAHFAEGAKAGVHDLIITGYSPTVAPTIVRYTEKLTISSKQVAVTYAVEGLDRTITNGSAQAENALEGLVQLLTKNKVQYAVQAFSFGKYVAEIDHLSGGSLGGQDGWGFIVKRDGSWITPQVGIEDFALEAGDHVVVHYTNYATDAIQSIEIVPALPKANELFSIEVKKAVWDWEKSEVLVSPAVDVVVEVGELKAITNSKGKAEFSAGLPTGKHAITVSGYKENDAPTVNKATTEMYILEDQQRVSKWAEADVQKVMMSGLMHGTSTSSVIFDPDRSITRAEYAALLLRLIGEQPLANVRSGYHDIPASIWYEGVIAKAKQLGFINKTDVYFRPDSAITREELAVMTAKALGLSQNNSTISFSDLESAISGDSIPHIAAVTEDGILFGSDGKFMPLDPVTREMAAAVAMRIHAK
jgi:hypothetical protein